MKLNDKAKEAIRGIKKKYAKEDGGMKAAKMPHQLEAMKKMMGKKK